MNWQKLINRLAKRGWTQERLAKRCGTGQSTISDLVTGRTKQPSFELGVKLVDLSKSKITCPHG